MQYPTLTAPDAHTYLLARHSESPIPADALVRIQGDGKELEQSFVTVLRDCLAQLRSDWPKGLKNDKERNVFEGKAARLVHGIVPSEPELLGDPEFWIWLAVVHFHDLVEWRYGNPEGGTKLANYGIGSRVENLLYRLWLRAELVLDESADDRYHLVDAGQIDFYRSHLIRQSFANARNFARALLRFQYPNEDMTVPRLKILEIRDLVKRLRRLRSNLFLEILGETECLIVIESEATFVNVT